MATHHHFSSNLLKHLGPSGHQSHPQWHGQIICLQSVSLATLTYKYHEGGKLERLGIVDHHAFAPGAITDPPQLIDLTGSCFTSSVYGRFRGLGVSSYLEADFRSLTLIFVGQRCTSIECQCSTFNLPVFAK